MVRKIIDSGVLSGLFELPPGFENRRIEIILLPTEEPATADLPRFTRAQIEEWAKDPQIQSLVGALGGTELPADITMKDIREMRLVEKYRI